MTLMNIGQAATASGVSAKMIRHYESAGLFPEVVRTDAGYRQYTGRDVHTLRFIRQSRDLGFSLDQIGNLLALWQDRSHTSRQVKALAIEHIRSLDAKLRELQSVKATLEHLVHCCHGDDRPDCPILDRLAENAEQATTSMTRSGRATIFGIHADRAAAGSNRS